MPPPTPKKVVPLYNFIVISLAYCSLTFTDGALRTVVLLHCTTLGFTPLEIAAMFMLYELAGVFTNLLGGASSIESLSGINLCESSNIPPKLADADNDTVIYYFRCLHIEFLLEESINDPRFEGELDLSRFEGECHPPTYVL